MGWSFFGLFGKHAVHDAPSPPILPRSPTPVPESVPQEAAARANELEQKVVDMQGQYTAIDDTKKAMLNLLEDARVLEKDLKEERDRATAIVSSIGEGLFVVDGQYRITLANPAAEKYLGFVAKDVTGENLTKVAILFKGTRPIPDEDRPLMRTIKTGEPCSMLLEDDIYIQTPKGPMPIALSTACIRRDNEIIGGLVTFYDLTRDKEIKNTIEHQVKERTQELSAEHARLTASINSLVAGFILTDPDSNILVKNLASITMLGITNDTKSLEEVEKFVEGKIQLHDLHERSRKEKKSMNLKDIELHGRFMEVFIAPIFVDTEKTDFIGSVILIQDVTEAKVLQRSRDEFFSIASHELRTPLTAIRGNTSMLQEFYAEKMDDQMKEMVNDVHESSIQLIDIVNDFLNMSRLEQGKIEFKNEAFDLPDLINSVLKEYQVTGSRTKLYLKYNPPEKPVPLVFADKSRVKEILINLVGNAIKFTEEGGVTVNIYLHDGHVRVIVEDTGRGIPFENQVLLFRKFQQAGDSLFTRDTKKGTGLGLYISKLLAEGMHGTIGLVHSQPGKGSAFGFALPVAPGQGIEEPKQVDDFQKD